MFEKERILKQLEEATDEQKKQMLQDELGVSWDLGDGPCKVWFAQVFTYCHSCELQAELNFFFFLVNLLAQYFNVCFQPEDTVSLDCTCPCGNKQVILYYSITSAD